MYVILRFYFPGLESQGILSMGHGKSWKMTKNDFSENQKAENTLNKLSFLHYFGNNVSILGHGKGHGKSWNFIRSK